MCSVLWLLLLTPQHNNPVNTITVLAPQMASELLSDLLKGVPCHLVPEPCPSHQAKVALPPSRSQAGGRLDLAGPLGDVA